MDTLQRSLTHLRTLLPNAVRPFSERHQLYTLPLHTNTTLGAFLFYSFVFHPFAAWASGRLAPRTYARLDRRGRINWNAHVVSMVQCVLICGLALRVVWTDPQRVAAAERGAWRERMWGYSDMIGLVQEFVVGYFAWDCVISVRHMDVMGVSSLVHGASALAVACLGFVS